MLRRIIILAGSENGFEGEAARLGERLSAWKIEVEYIPLEGRGKLCPEVEAALGEKISQGQGDTRNTGGGEEDSGLRECLFLTDSAGLWRRLEREGAYAAVVLRDENRGEDFSGARYAVEDVGEQSAEGLQKIYQRLAGEPWTILETERCLVRETTVEDVDSFYEIYADPPVTRYMEGLFEDREAEARYTEAYIKEVYGFYGYGMWSVLLKESGRVIGRAGLSWRPGFDDVELGFVFGVADQGKGYALEVCREILAYAEKELYFDQVQALVKEGNEASLRLCGRLGFERAGNVVDGGEEYMRLLRKAPVNAEDREEGRGGRERTDGSPSSADPCAAPEGKRFDKV